MVYHSYLYMVLFLRYLIFKRFNLNKKGYLIKKLWDLGYQKIFLDGVFNDDTRRYQWGINHILFGTIPVISIFEMFQLKRKKKLFEEYLRYLVCQKKSWRGIHCSSVSTKWGINQNPQSMYMFRSETCVDTLYYIK